MRICRTFFISVTFTFIYCSLPVGYARYWCVHHYTPLPDATPRSVYRLRYGWSRLPDVVPRYCGCVRCYYTRHYTDVAHYAVYLVVTIFFVPHVVHLRSLPFDLLLTIVMFVHVCSHTSRLRYRFRTLFGYRFVGLPTDDDTHAYAGLPPPILHAPYVRVGFYHRLIRVIPRSRFTFPFCSRVLQTPCLTRCNFATALHSTPLLFVITTTVIVIDVFYAICPAFTRCLHCHSHSHSCYALPGALPRHICSWNFTHIGCARSPFFPVRCSY